LKRPQKTTPMKNSDDSKRITGPEEKDLIFSIQIQ